MGIQSTATGILSAVRAIRALFRPFRGTLRSEYAPPDNTIESLAILRPVFSADCEDTDGTAFTLDDAQEVRPWLCVCPRCSARG